MQQRDQEFKDELAGRKRKYENISDGLKVEILNKDTAMAKLKEENSKLEKQREEVYAELNHCRHKNVTLCGTLICTLVESCARIYLLLLCLILWNRTMHFLNY